jgi:hypothetical protein
MVFVPPQDISRILMLIVLSMKISVHYGWILQLPTAIQSFRQADDTPWRRTSVIPLWMIRPKKQSVNGNSSNLRRESNSRIGKKRGGFGGTRELPISDDYAVFPALEKRIDDTLIPVAPDGSTTLTNEIYQRLDQIYGFDRFNFENNQNEEDNKQSGFMSLEEMISLSDENDDDPIESDSSPQLNSAKKPLSSLDLSMHLSKLPAFPKLRVLHIDPLVLAVDEFFTEHECDIYVERAKTNQSNTKSNKKM